MKKEKTIQKKIMIVEDDSAMLSLMEYSLTSEGYLVIPVLTGENCVRTVEEKRPDLVILDWVLPEKSGIEICEELRCVPDLKDLRIIMISSHSKGQHKITGLKKGADDYLEKPFIIEELVLRVKNLLKRSSIEDSDILKFMELTLDLRRHSCTIEENGVAHEITLGPIEFKLCQLLLMNSEKLVSRDRIIALLWNSTTMEMQHDKDKILNVHMTRLRSSLLKYPSSIDIKTIRGYGYKMVKVVRGKDSSEGDH
ncbi:response regulator transcription factor [Candidatus Fokinia crypta]|uniref:Transcriptional regulato n=1 Tax=Candidatus Fokinia crypta TaxID=1920990 RepID=A0ABZ0UPT0_9RICK|nr:response regulator transcription factor [Candidatus Fokinia cryptica]WPX98141.1 Transcriptional regulato [Candidatus Fokinia cryptica]